MKFGPTILTVFLFCLLHCLMFAHGQITYKQKQYIWKKHNELREKLRRCELPNHHPAKEMRLLRWNKTLEMGAQAWADKCTESRQPHAVESSVDLSIGQNFAKAPSVEDVKVTQLMIGKVEMPTNHLAACSWQSATTGKLIDRSFTRLSLDEYMSNLCKAIQKWFDGSQHYNPTRDVCSGANCNQYKRLIIGRARIIGCGVKLCHQHAENSIMVVCHYGPVLSFRHHRPYVPGNDTDCVRGDDKELEKSLTEDDGTESDTDIVDVDEPEVEEKQEKPEMQDNNSTVVPTAQ